MGKFSQTIQKVGKPENLLIFLVWLVYSMSYLGKLNYSANIIKVIDYYHITKAQAGAVPTFFFFAYGVGQVVNGFLCKKYNVKYMVFASLIVSASINLFIAISPNFHVVKWLWMINGFALSILWPTLVRALSEHLPKKALGFSSVVVGTTVAIGTLIIYGLSSIFAALDMFKLAFYTAGIVAIITAFVWLCLYNTATTRAKREKDAEGVLEESGDAAPVQVQSQKSEKKILFATIGVLCFYAVGVNLIKDGLTTWVPSILKESFAVSDSLSILLTLLLPILAVFGNAYALKVHKKVPDYAHHCAIVFVAMTILICVIIGSLVMEIIAIMLLGLVAVNFLASSLNSLITSIFPLFMREKLSSGSFAGILNGFCYVGSTISSYGLGVIADNYGWLYVFWTLIGFCVLACIVWGVYFGLKHLFLKEN